MPARYEPQDLGVKNHPLLWTWVGLHDAQHALERCVEAGEIARQRLGWPVAIVEILLFQLAALGMARAHGRWWTLGPDDPWVVAQRQTEDLYRRFASEAPPSPEHPEVRPWFGTRPAQGETAISPEPNEDDE